MICHQIVSTTLIVFKVCVALSLHQRRLLAPSLNKTLADPKSSFNQLSSGNEKDYVILSSVRTKQPGFLRSQPRMNVALTRCRKGMVVVTDKSFLQGAGRTTLLGQLCNTWLRHHNACWIDSRAMLNNSGALPGLPAPAPSRPTPNSHNLNWRTTMPPPRNSPSQQNQTRTFHWHDQTYPSARATTLSPSFVHSVHRLSSPATAAAGLGLESTRIILGLPNPNYQRRNGGGGGGGGHSHGRAWSAATVVRRDLGDNEFPSLQPLATALDIPSSRQHNWRDRR